MQRRHQSAEQGWPQPPEDATRVNRTSMLAWKQKAKHRSQFLRFNQRLQEPFKGVEKKSGERQLLTGAEGQGGGQKRASP